MPEQTILLVEDTELIRRMFHDKLVEDGYKVLVAVDGLEALNLLRTNLVDLVLLDLIMPRMSGLEALEAMKADPRTKDIPVIVLSNLGQDSDIEKCIDLGAADYLIKNSAKPADVSEKIRLTLDFMGGRAGKQEPIRLLVRDREGDADRLVDSIELPRRFWCPACEVELNLELLPNADRPGWFDTHIVCSKCGREFGI